ncbi:MAG: hypothetical protein Q4C52_07115 [Eubacteriales bacterium]|nr:hypothetical protein [Eubacteriales bacterium]
METVVNEWVAEGKDAFLLTGARQIGKTIIFFDEIQKFKDIVIQELSSL